MNSMGSSRVMITPLRVSEMRLTIEARVVDLPEPVMPVTSTRPLRRLQKSCTTVVMAEGFEFGDFLDDEAERGLDIAAGHVDVAAEPSDAFDLERVVEFPIPVPRWRAGTR